MGTNDSPVEYVLRSGARTDVLLAIDDGQDTTQALLDRDLASKSAVYNALTELEECGLIHAPRPKRWAPTGAGTVVAELIERQQETEAVLRADAEYWRMHDVTAIPEAHRARLGDLSGGRVVRATDTQPSRVVRGVERRIQDADAVDVVAPIYDDRYASALRDAERERSRLVLDGGVLDDLLDGSPADESRDDEVDVRITDASFALTVTDDCVLLSLPDVEGDYDARTEFVAESERAIRWGTDLFERFWDDAPTPEEYLSTR